MENQYLMQPSEQVGWWVATDKVNGIVIRFQAHKFNDTQEVTILEDIENLDATKLAGVMREFGNWISSNYYDLAM